MLVAPVEAGAGFLQRFALHDDGLRTDRADLRIAEAGDDVAQAVAIERLAHIVEHEDFARNQRHARIQRRGFTAAFHAQKLYAWLAKLRAISSVRSVEPSETTRISISSRG